MGLFDAKYCSICGEKISLMGNRKLEDGNMCKNCASKLSPFLSDRRHTTIDEIKQHLQYREENKQRVSQFNPTMTLGNETKVYIDQNTGTFTVSSARNWRETNPDIINISQVSGVFTEAKENKKEIFRKDAEGHNVSYNPKRYEYSYEFETTINVNSPYFDEIKFDLTTYSNRPKQVGDMAYRNFEQMGMQISQALGGGMNGMGMGMNNMGMGMQGGMGMNNMGNMNMGMNGMNQGMGMQQGMGNMMGAMAGGGLAGVAGQVMGQVANAAMNGLAGNDMTGMNQGMNSGMQGGMNPGMQGGMNGMGMQQGMNPGMQGGMNGMGMQQGMNPGMQGGMNGMGMQQGMNPGMQGGMNGMGMQQGMNPGMQGGMNGMGMQQGMNPGMQGGMNGMGMQQGMNPGMQAGTWVCDCCGTTNTGDVCVGCSNPRPM
jgi:hypothetical protein